jgi:TPR repeat protein
MELYYPCCGKEICKGCVHSFSKTDNDDKCPYCNSDRVNKTDNEDVEEAIKRVEANDPVAMCILATFYRAGEGGLQQDEERAMELFTRAADLGYYKARLNLGNAYYRGGEMKKAKLHYEAAAMAGDVLARFDIGCMEAESNMERAIKHWSIAASAGCYDAMNQLRILFELGAVSRESIDSTLAAYNNSCAEFRSEARDAFIQSMLETD